MSVLGRIKSGEVELHIAQSWVDLVPSADELEEAMAQDEKDKSELLELAEIGERMRWTLTTDSLPPEPVNLYDSCNYLITVINDQVVSARYVKTKVRNKEVCRWEWNNKLPPWEVIAWMPFPNACKLPPVNEN